MRAETSWIIDAMVIGQIMFLWSLAVAVLLEYARTASRGVLFWHVQCLAASYLILTGLGAYNIQSRIVDFNVHPWLVALKVVAALLGDVGLLLMLRVQFLRAAAAAFQGKLVQAVAEATRPPEDAPL